MNQADIDDAISSTLNQYAYGNWQNVIEYYGEELAGELDFTDEFSYEEVYDRGDVKECTAFYNIAIIQRCIVACLFDLRQNDEAKLTYHTLEYTAEKLFDKATGVNVHSWIH